MPLTDPLLSYGDASHWKLQFPTDVTLGRVTRLERDWDQVATQDGLIDCERHLGTYESSLEPSVGDWVSVSTDGRPAITALARRTNSVVRRRTTENSRPQVLASNVDHAWIVVALDAGLNRTRLVRQTIMMLEAGIWPTVVGTKPDLVPGDALDRCRRTVTDVSRNLDLVICNPVTRIGVKNLEKLTTPNSTTLLVGASGAGKSSLINALTHSDLMETGEVRRSDRRGRHTTTFRQMVPLTDGATIIDTPGIRSVGLIDVERGLQTYFADIYEALTNCEFSNCSHNQEASCGLVHSEISRSQIDLWRELSAESRQS